MSMDTPYAPPQQPPAGTLAIVSLILGIVGLLGVLGGCCCCFSHLFSLCAPVAAVLGYMERKAIQEGRSSPAGAGMAQAGMIMGMVGTALIVLYIIIVIIWVIVSGFSSVVHTLTRGQWPR
jgi:hypothetical protein